MQRRNFLYLLSSFSAVSAFPLPFKLASTDPSSFAIHSNAGFADVAPFDPDMVPFSCIGSYLVLNRANYPGGDGRLRIATVSKRGLPSCGPGGAYSWDLYELAMMIDGREQAYSIEATPLRIQMKSKSSPAWIELCFCAADTLRLEMHGCAVELRLHRPMTWAYSPAAGQWRGYDFQSQYFSECEAENIRYDGSDPKNTRILLQGTTAVLRLRETESREFVSLSAAAAGAAAMQTDFDTWMRKNPPVDTQYKNAAATAWFLFWNLQVAPQFGLTRQTILSSKRIMSQIWSWDNCFNALAVASVDYRLAWNQLFAILDQQRASGVLPDTVNDAGGIFGFNKPPVWGWTIERLLQNTPAAEQKKLAAEAYPAVAKFQRWWFAYRDLLHDGVPFYMHGNDSGWDNSTIFDEKAPVQSPDLCAWLITQADQLAKMATLLGREQEAAEWRTQSQTLLQKFIATFVRGDALIYRVLTPNGIEARQSTSLLTRMPLVLGNRLPAAVRQRMVSDLGDPAKFFSSAGPSSEELSSAKYEPNGYWRGPVWGPTTYILCDALIAIGETNLAEKLANRFCETCSRDGNFRENYNAKTQAGQYDSGMTWSAADFLLLARWLKNAG